MDFSFPGIFKWRLVLYCAPSAGHVIFKFQHLVLQKLSRGIFTYSKGIHLHSPLEFGEFWVQIRQACKVQINLEYVFCGNRISIGVDETSSWFMLALYTNVCFSQEAYWRVPQQHNDFELAFFFIPLTLPALFSF